MSLYQKPPESLTIQGKEYPIDTDFRVWVKFQGILLGKDTDGEKAENLCRIMEEMGLPLVEETLNAMVQFYEAASTENATGGGKSVQAFDFEKDSEYIFSAFLESYGIDLSTANLHWWRFKALFKSLPADCEMCKIMQYRVVELNKVPKEQRQFYKKMKERYSLEPVKICRTKEDLIERAKQRKKEAKSHMSGLRSGQ